MHLSLFPPPPPPLLLLLWVTLSFVSHQSAAAVHHRHPALSHPLQAEFVADASPTTYFEVTKPIKVPKTKPCSHLILHHDFAYTYGKSPVLAPYTPPSDCPSKEFSTIILEWNATSKGRQFDRIFGVWLGGVELLRSCTAEPRATGIVWKVEKDITRYYSLLMINHTLAVYLGNLIDSTYTGVYHVDLSIHFYPAEKTPNFLRSGSRHRKIAANLGKPSPGYGDYADLIMPISRNLPLNDGLWFEVENSTDVESKEFVIPENAYRAVLEVYVSFHENDEFWYTNLPDEYIQANHLSGYPGNGPFREVVVSLDGDVVGAIWPFTVVYTGGINPLFWRPITGIGSFDLPTYDIEITPFLGNLLDGKTHSLAFTVTNALNVWYVDANLHLWLDKNSNKTHGELLRTHNGPATLSSKLNFDGFDGKFLTKAKRSLVSTGWVQSSQGRITTHSKQKLEYENVMVMGNNANLQIVDQTIDFDTVVSAKSPSSSDYRTKSYKTFPLHMYTNEVSLPNNSYASVTNLTLVFDEKKTIDLGSGSLTSYLNNVENAEGVMVVKNNLVINGSASTQEAYKYDGGDGFCYFRNVSSSNYTILHDVVSDHCSRKSGSELGRRFGNWWDSVKKTVYGIDA